MRSVENFCTDQNQFEQVISGISDLKVTESQLMMYENRTLTPINSAGSQTNATSAAGSSNGVAGSGYVSNYRGHGRSGAFGQQPFGRRNNGGGSGGFSQDYSQRGSFHNRNFNQRGGRGGNRGYYENRNNRPERMHDRENMKSPDCEKRDVNGQLVEQQATGGFIVHVNHAQQFVPQNNHEGAPETPMYYQYFPAAPQFLQPPPGYNFTQYALPQPAPLTQYNSGPQQQVEQWNGPQQFDGNTPTEPVYYQMPTMMMMPPPAPAPPMVILTLNDCTIPI